MSDIVKRESALDKFKTFARSPMIMERFEELLGDRGARAYVSSVVLAVAGSPKLQQCTSASIVSSALRAATLELSCDVSLGQAALVPFGRTATLIVQHKGLRDLALRTGKYKYIHVDKIYEGEGVDIDRFTGHARMIGNKTGEGIAGWVASFAMLNGFTKTIFMTVEEIHDHGKKYSKSYNHAKGYWKTQPRVMERKTVLRKLLLDWGTLDARDKLNMNLYDEAEAEELDYIESEFVPVEEDEPETEADLIAALGYGDKAVPVEAEYGWPKAWLDALVTAGLCKANKHAANTLNKSKAITHDSPMTPEEIVTWVTWYRADNATGADKLLRDAWSSYGEK